MKKYFSPPCTESECSSDELLIVLALIRLSNLESENLELNQQVGELGRALGQEAAAYQAQVLMLVVVRVVMVVVMVMVLMMAMAMVIPSMWSDSMWSEAYQAQAASMVLKLMLMIISDAKAHAYNANNAKVAAKEQELRRLQEELRQQGDQYTRLLDTKVMIFT